MNQDNWDEYALTWLKDENDKFGSSMRQMFTYLIVGNAAGFVSILRLIPDSEPSIPTALIFSVWAFPLGLFFGMLSGLLLVKSQRRCLTDYRKKVVALRSGDISIHEFIDAPNYLQATIGTFIVLALLAFVAGGAGIVVWVSSLAGGP